MGVSYVELHAHSAYSFLDGASQPEELAVRAAELGYPALALTDHDGVYGSLEFAHAAKHLGVRAITGAEVTLDGGAHVTLLVETPQGYANLCWLLTAAHAHTRPQENREPLPPSLDQRRLEELHDGLVCLSGCAREGLAVRDPNAAARLAHAAKHFCVRPITGAEVTLADESHVTLLVESACGYANLCRLLTAAHAHTRDTTNREPLPPRLDLALLEELHEGLVCLSGCEAPSRKEYAECACSST